MFQELKFQLSTALLTVLSVAAVVAAALNFQQLHKTHLPTDGVIWVDRVELGRSAVVAHSVSPESGAAHAGIRVGDVLMHINAANIQNATDAARLLYGRGVWSTVNYVISRHGVEFPVDVIVRESAARPRVILPVLHRCDLSCNWALRLYTARKRL